MLRNGGQDAEHEGKRFGRTTVAVVGFAAVELLAEVLNDRAVEVTARVIKGRGDVLKFVQVADGPDLRTHTTRSRPRQRERYGVCALGGLPASNEPTKETIEATGLCRFDVDGEQGRPPIDHHWQPASC
jgi:hypothetical protein